MSQSLADYTVSVTDTIRDAMRKIDRNKHRVVVVLDGEYVVGTVSDGDVRRAFLNDVLPIAPVEKIMNVNCTRTQERDPARLRALVLELRVTVLPVVDVQNRLLDVAVAYEPFGSNAEAGTVQHDASGE